MTHREIADKFKEEIRQTNLVLGQKARDAIKEIILSASDKSFKITKIQSHTIYVYNDNYDEQQSSVDFTMKIGKSTFTVTQSYYNSFTDNIDSDIYGKHAKIFEKFATAADCIFEIVSELEITGVLYESK